MSFFDGAIVASLPMFPKFLMERVAGRYVAGSSLPDAVTVVKRMMDTGNRATVDLLGENAQEREESREAVSIYKRVLAAIQKDGLDANISVKPTHLGLRIDGEFCFRNINELVAEAEGISNFVRIDMEDHTTTTDTLELYKRLRENHGNVGVAIQSYLRRSEKDVRALASQNANFRICKGIYVEPPQVAYQQMHRINESFLALLEIMFEAGSYVGIATHDDELIEGSERLIDKLGLGSQDYEFQMLLGVKERTRQEVVARGHKMRVYVPFGSEWYPYSLRRLKENPKLARYVMRELLKWERFP
ncbi:MAG: proline dehydrogenase family protein [Thermoplasmata archaeon]